VFPNPSPAKLAKASLPFWYKAIYWALAVLPLVKRHSLTLCVFLGMLPPSGLAYFGKREMA
jgi:hypothetical protein